ncbi:MAG: hypothetical protein GQ564_03425 [Bacteroidales bacterium]|nr:hypothetical protein [Bacteroidales bacterium]
MREFRSVLALIASVLIDLIIFLRRSSIILVETEEKMLALMTYNYHTIEKGLSMKDIRYGFGQIKVNTLLDRVKKYLAKDFNVNKSQFIASCSVLDKYYVLHEDIDFDISRYFSYIDYTLIKKYANSVIGGAINIDSKDYFSKNKSDYENFSKSRHSIRNFSLEPIGIDKISKAVNLAKYCPSACNRQSVKVYLVNKKEEIREILRTQKGILSTSELVNQLLVITADRGYFFTSGERNQHFVDGGIFLQSLLLSLHYKEIAACPLHWSLNIKQDNKIRSIVKFSKGEKVISLIAVGNIVKNIRVPASYRKPLNEIFSVVK